MSTDVQVGDLVKLRGMNKGNFPIGIIIRIFPDSWAKDKSFADIKWSNPEIASKWGIVSPVSIRTIEKVE
tara:strand:+ start:184 stop:393 length:210 start_codon:yes stop_codon:yes gene_type:complete